jgi:glucose/arabinose dehydrogenase
VWDGLKVIRNYPTGTTVTTLYSGLPQVADHNNRALAIAPDGTIFESSGSSCNVCNPSSSLEATIVHMNGDGTNATVYATGVRNGSGLAFDAGGQLWMVVNQRDGIGDDIPADEFDKLAVNGDYGWPTCYPDQTGARKPNPEYPSATCAGQLPVTFPLQAHSAPLGIVIYNGSMFPASYKGGAFVAFHGSWDRTIPTGYKVVFVSISSGAPTGISDFVTGWLTTLTQGATQAGRPVGLAVGADGSLYISDDQNGFIYRVTYG